MESKTFCYITSFAKKFHNKNCVLESMRRALIQSRSCHQYYCRNVFQSAVTRYLSATAFESSESAHHHLSLEKDVLLIELESTQKLDASILTSLSQLPKSNTSAQMEDPFIHTDSTARSHHHQSQEALELELRDLCEVPPIGSWTTEAHWNACDQLLGELVKIPPTSLESVEMVFSVLERMMLEHEQQICLDQSTKLLSTTLLNTVVKHWMKCWKHVQKAGRDAQIDKLDQQQQQYADAMLTPQQMHSRVEDYASQCAPYLQPDGKTYTMIMNAAVHDHDSNLDVSMPLVENLFQKLSHSKWLDSIAYTIMITACSRTGNAPRAEALFRQMYQEYQQDGNHLVKPTVWTLNCVLHTWTRSKERRQKKNAPFRIQAILDHIITSNTTHSIVPNISSYNILLNAWAVSGHPDACKRVDSILDQMEEQQQNQHVSLFPKPNNVSYTTVMTTWARAGNVAKVEAILNRALQRSQQEKDPRFKPDVRAYTMVLVAWSQSKDPEAPEHAQRFLQRMIDSCKSISTESSSDTQDGPASLDVPVVPNVYTFNEVLHCWAKSNRPDAGVRAQEFLIKDMKNSDHAIQPNTSSYNHVMNAWIGSGQQQFSPERATKILDHMFAAYQQGNHHVKPDSFSFSIVLNAWARSKEPDAPERAEAILQRMIELSKMDKTYRPDVVCYTTVLTCWANSGRTDAGERAEAILAEMEKQAQAGDSGVKPNTISYTTAISARARLGQAKHAESLLQQMFNEFMGGNANAKPGIQTFTTVLNAWSKSKDVNAPERAEAILNHMKGLSDTTAGNGMTAINDHDKILDVEPNSISYSVVLNCWAQSGRPDAGEKAEAILAEMEEQALAGNEAVKPCTICYNTVMNAWAKNGQARQAENLLLRMYDTYCRETKDGMSDAVASTKPNISSFNTVLHAWSQFAAKRSATKTSNGEDKKSTAPERAEAILKQMQKRFDSGSFDVEPNVVSYTTVLHCWANSGRKDAGDRAEALLKEMEETTNIKPNHVTYNAVIKALVRSGKKDRADVLRKRFSAK